MSSTYLRYLVVFGAVAAAANAQTFQRRATLVGGGNPGEGRCVVEVVVDGAAQVEIRGDSAMLRNLKGQAPQWRRFECTSPMPANPVGFRFAGIDGRGRQDLVQSPQNGGVAVVHIEDSDNGSEGYTFEVRWGGGEMSRGGPPVGQSYPVQPFPPQQVQPQPNFGQGQDRRYDGNGNGNDRGGFNGSPNRFYTDDAIRVCQVYVREQAARRYRANDVIFRRTIMDDQPGRNDWVKGFFEARSVNGRAQNYQFSCSVDFDRGTVRSSTITMLRSPQGAYGDMASGKAIQSCEASVEQRLIHDGYRRVDFGQVNVDDRPGRNDLVLGVASALERDRPTSFDFSCQVDLKDGDVRSAEVTRR